MKTRLLLLLIALGLLFSAFGQKSVLEFTFSGSNNGIYTSLDSIKIVNKTHSCDTLLTWPDTVLVVDYQTGISTINNGKPGFRLFQNYPNPVEDKTTICLYIPEKDLVRLCVTDMKGRRVSTFERSLGKGDHSFRFTPGGAGLWFVSAQWRGKSSTIKVLIHDTGIHREGSFEYLEPKRDFPKVETKEVLQDFIFLPGDNMLFTGYSNGLQSGILDFPDSDEMYIFEYAINIPCPGIPTVTYEGKVYNTIQLFSQCWLKENLNTGIMINSNQNMLDNGITEKYCYNNDENNCDVYGGLYLWNEMMQYTAEQGIQGICPPGWHIPSDGEWKLLEGAADSLYRIGDAVWNASGIRGFNAGITLKSTTGWNSGCTGTDLFGFSALPGGARSTNLQFYDMGEYAWFWTSTETGPNTAWLRTLICSSGGIDRGNYYRNNAASVRCVRD